VIVGNLREEARPVSAIFPGPNALYTFARITDGMSNTILFAQRSEPVCWMDPTGDVPIKVAVQGINAVKNGLGSLNGTEGINIAFADGAVKFAPSMGPNAMLEAALTCNGGERVPWEEKLAPASGDIAYNDIVDSLSQKPSKALVSGTVTLDGKPLADVMVSFMLQATPIAGYGTKTMADGRFAMPLPAGDYRVMVQKIDTLPQLVAIPEKYRMPATTPLTVTLKDGANEVKLELVSP
jgi:prepilin-type processing-associated H-X9-DG protein